MPTPVEYQILPEITPARPPALRRAHGQYMWLAQLETTADGYIQGQEQEDRDYFVVPIPGLDLERGQQALADWDATRTEFLSLVDRAGRDIALAVDLDREMRTILRAANDVGLSLYEDHWPEEVALEVFRRWPNVVAQLDRFEDEVALVLASRDQTRPARPVPGGTAAATTDDPPAERRQSAAGEDAPGANTLSLRARDLLTAMLGLRALTERTRRKRVEVVQAVNRYHTVDMYVDAFGELRRRGFYDSRPGQHGAGVWLSKSGQAEARLIEQAGE